MMRMRPVLAITTFVPITLLWAAHFLGAPMDITLFVEAILFALIGTAACAYIFIRAGSTLTIHSLARAVWNADYIAVGGAMAFATSGVIVGVFGTIAQPPEITDTLFEIDEPFATIGLFAFSGMICFYGTSLASFAAEKWGISFGWSFLQFILAVIATGASLLIASTGTTFWFFGPFFSSALPTLFAVLVFVGVSTRIN